MTHTKKARFYTYYQIYLIQSHQGCQALFPTVCELFGITIWADSGKTRSGPAFCTQFQICAVFTFCGIFKSSPLLTGSQNRTKCEACLILQNQTQTVQSPGVPRTGGRQVDAGGVHADVAQHIRRLCRVPAHPVEDPGKQVAQVVLCGTGTALRLAEMSGKGSGQVRGDSVFRHIHISVLVDGNIVPERGRPVQEENQKMFRPD